MQTMHISSSASLAVAETLRPDQIAMLIDTLIGLHGASRTMRNDYLQEYVEQTAALALRHIGGQIPRRRR